MHLLIPVHCATSCAFSVLSLALVGLFLVFVWAYKFQHSGKLSLGGVLTWESLPDGARSLSRGFSLKRQPCDSKIPIEMVESQRRFSYDSQPPVSMAKMIMSRHTFRRPAPKIALPPPPPRAVIPPPPRRTRSLSPPRQQRAQSSPRQPPSTMV